nr:hypothetical protein RAR13_04410 [Aminobacter aminovorans]
MIRTWRYTLWALCFLAFVMALLLLARPAAAQALCAPAPDLLRGLGRLGQFVILKADAGDRQIVVTRAHDGAWSIVVVREDVGCLVMGGKASQLDKGV